jgi:hypothetical protein
MQLRSWPLDREAADHRPILESGIRRSPIDATVYDAAAEGVNNPD